MPPNSGPAACCGRSPMVKYEVIVVGTDGSRTAGTALDHAITLAQATGAQLHVVFALDERKALDFAHVVEASGDSADVAAFNAGMRNQSKEICDAAIAAAEAAEVQCYAQARPGDAAAVLMEVAGELRADLLVVGNRGMTGMRRMLGSVPNTISHHAPCSVLIVQTDASDEEQ